MPPSIKILLADDHDLIRESWKHLLGTDPRLEVIAVVDGGQKAIEQSLLLRPDIILMDINMSPINGFEATEKIIRTLPSAKVIGISVNNSPLYAQKMLTAGAKGFVTKTSTLDELKNAILKVHEGDTYICEEIRRKQAKEGK